MLLLPAAALLAPPPACADTRIAVRGLPGGARVSIIDPPAAGVILVIDGRATATSHAARPAFVLSSERYGARVHRIAIRNRATRLLVASRLVRLRQAAPAVALLAAPSGTTSLTSATVTFATAPADAVVTCSRDGAPAATCDGSFAVAGLTAGAHRIDVAARAAGRTATATARWVVAAPTIAVVAAPSGTITTRAASLQWTTNGPTTSCAVDGALPASCVSPLALADLADGVHTVVLRATTSAGTATATARFEVAATPPAVAVTSAPSGTIATRTATVAWTSNGATTCAVDGAGPVACTSPLALVDLADGTHDVVLRVSNPVGTATATARFSVAASPPAISVTSAPAGTITTRDAAVAWTSTTTQTTCSLDGAVATPCASPLALSGLADGHHAVVLRAADAAGEATATVSFDVMATPPSLAVTSAPTGTQVTRSASISFTADAPATCSLDGAAALACSSPLALAALADGHHVVLVRAVNLAGEASATVAFDVMATAPTIAITSAPTGTITTRAASVAWTATAPTTCALDGAAATPCASPLALGGLADGSHALVLRATNAAGSAQVSVAFDVAVPALPPPTPAPVVAILSQPPASTTATTAAVGFTLQNAGSATCAVDGAAPVSCISPFPMTGLAVGSHSLVVRAETAGGSSSATATWAIVPHPTVAITAAPASSTATSATVGFAASGTTITCRLDGATQPACASPASVTGLSVASHQFTVSATRADETVTATATWLVSADPRPKLAWAPPTLTSPLTIDVPATGGSFTLAAGQDYVVHVGDVNGLGGVVLTGGRNVVIMGGRITIPAAGTNPTTEQRRGLLLRNQTGTVHVEGLLIRDGGDLAEGIQIAAPTAIVQIENSRVENIHARDEVGFTDNHPDLIQVWGGVAELRVDRFSGSSDYQGIFFRNDQAPVGKVDLRHVSITGLPTARFLLWQADRIPTTYTEVWLNPPGTRSLGVTAWPAMAPYGPSPDEGVVAGDGLSVSWPRSSAITGTVRRGLPPGGDFVAASDVGVGYSSPGYG